MFFCFLFFLYSVSLDLPCFFFFLEFSSLIDICFFDPFDPLLQEGLTFDFSGSLSATLMALVIVINAVAAKPKDSGERPSCDLSNLSILSRLHVKRSY